jgi:cytochrome P450 family 110
MSRAPSVPISRKAPRCALEPMTTPRELALPDGPRMAPALQLLQWVARPAAFMDACAARYGDVFTLRIGGTRQPIVFVSHPEMIRDVFTGDPAVFHAGEANTFAKALVGERSVLLLDGAPHQRQRKLLMPPFHGARMQAYAAVMAKATRDEAARWRERGPAFSAHQAFKRISLEVILRAVFGIADAERMADFRGSLNRLMALSGRAYVLLMVRPDGSVRAPDLHRWLGRVSPLTRFERLRLHVDQQLFAEFKRRRETGTRGEDILSLLMDARDDAGEPMTDVELRDELITLLVAGHETTATSLAWVFAEVLRRPEVLARMRAEYAAVIGAGAVEAHHVGKLEYTGAVIQEVLRLNPIIPIVMRSLQAPARVGTVELPAGTIVCPCVYLAQRRVDVWGDPAVFRPERFLEREKKAAPFEWFPFGGGARRCIGMAFAMFEMKIVLAEILSRYDVSLRHAAAPARVRRGISLAPARGVPIVARRRAS